MINDQKPGILNISRMSDFISLIGHASNYAEFMSDCIVNYSLQDQFKNSGSIEIKGKYLRFSCPEVFLQLSKYASGVEIILCSDGDVSVIFSFNDLVTLMKG